MLGGFGGGFYPAPVPVVSSRCKNELQSYAGFYRFVIEAIWSYPPLLRSVQSGFGEYWMSFEDAYVEGHAALVEENLQPYRSFDVADFGDSWVTWAHTLGKRQHNRAVSCRQRRKQSKDQAGYCDARKWSHRPDRHRQIDTKSSLGVPLLYLLQHST